MPPPIKEYYIILDNQNVGRARLLALFHDNRVVEFGLDSVALVPFHLVGKREVFCVVMIRGEPVRHIFKPWLVVVLMSCWVGMC